MSSSATACPSCGSQIESHGPYRVTNGSTGGPAVIALIGSAIVVTGSVLSWVSATSLIGSMPIRAISEVRPLTFIAGVAGGAAACWALLGRKGQPRLGMVSLVVGLAGGLVGLVVLLLTADVARAASVSEGGVLTSLGTGLWLLLVGSASMVGASVTVRAQVIPSQSVRISAAWVGIAIGLATLTIYLLAFNLAPS